jgi:hypothetical protein
MRRPPSLFSSIVAHPSLFSSSVVPPSHASSSIGGSHIPSPVVKLHHRSPFVLSDGDALAFPWIVLGRRRPILPSFATHRVAADLLPSMSTAFQVDHWR